MRQGLEFDVHIISFSQEKFPFVWEVQIMGGNISNDIELNLEPEGKGKNLYRAYQ